MKSGMRGGQKVVVERTKISRNLAAVVFGGRKGLEKAASLTPTPAEFNNNTSIQHLGGNGGHAWHVVGGTQKKREETIQALQRGEIAALIKRKVNIGARN